MSQDTEKSSTIATAPATVLGFPESRGNQMVIDQEKLEELLLFRRYSIEYRNIYRQRLEAVRGLLLAGADVEEGIHVAHLQQCRECSGARCRHSQLVIDYRVVR